MPRLFSTSNRSRMSSTYVTTSNQGGGSKKAGFPYQVGRDTWVSHYLNTTNPISGQCCKLSSWNTTVFPLSRLSRNVGSTANFNGYFTAPGTRTA